MKIHIDTPCHENWDNMAPTDKGAFCFSCQKQVVDFSNKTLSDIKLFFQKLPSTEKVCGRFENDQLEALSFDDFFKRFRKWHLLHKIAVICFFTFGMGLFSCAPQQEPGKDLVMGDSIQLTDTARNKETMIDNQAAPGDSLKPVKHPVVGGVKATPPVSTMGKVKVKPIQKSRFLTGDIAWTPTEDSVHGVKCLPKPGIDSTSVRKMGEAKIEK